MIARIDDLDLRGRVTFIRVDFNVPLTPGKQSAQRAQRAEAGGTASPDRDPPDWEVADDTRIRETLPTIELAIEKGARVVLASHLGRPGGKRQPDMSLEPAGRKLAELLGKDVVFADDCVGDGVKKNIKDLREGDVLLLENLRFHKSEEKNDEDFARALADGVDVYINDAFGTAHRAHASTVGMVRFVRDKGAGLLMMKELEHLGQILESPKQPFVAIVGGAKVSDKIGILTSLVERCNVVLIGGAMAYTFLRAKGKKTGKSKIEADAVELAEKIIKAASARKVQFLLPEDHVVAATFDEGAAPEVVSEIQDDRMGLDIGPKTRDRYRRVIQEAKTIFWNGPMGVFEWDSFGEGTLAIAQAVAESGAVSVVGGGDSVAALNKAGLEDRITHVSTGGGASMEFVEGKQLPGVKALEE